MDILFEIQNYADIFSDFINKMTQKQYYYIDNDSFLKLYAESSFNGEMNKCMKVYWREILFRSHFASIISIIRNAEWISGLEYSVKSDNLLVFASSMRGLIESVTDSYYSLEVIPTGLALNFKNIKEALDGRLEYSLFDDEFERLMIHFEFASQEEKVTNNVALSAGKYIKEFDEGNNVNCKRLYSTLCQLTHPSSMSIRCFQKLTKTSDGVEYCETNFNQDKEKICALYNEHSKAIKMILHFSLFLPVICLKIINLFDFDELYSEYLDECIANTLITEEKMSELYKMINMGEEYLKE